MPVVTVIILPVGTRLICSKSCMVRIKLFVKTPRNRQKERCWTLVHPYEFEEQQKQSDKIMTWVGLVDREI